LRPSIKSGVPVKTRASSQNPIRITVDNKGRIPSTSQILNDEAETIIYCDRLKEGAQYSNYVEVAEGTEQLPAIMADLHKRDVTSGMKPAFLQVHRILLRVAKRLNSARNITTKRLSVMIRFGYTTIKLRMFYLVLSIVCSTSIFLIFRQFSRYEIDNFQAIVFNYLTAALIGFSLSEADYGFSDDGSNTWIWVAVLMGILFISMFNVIAITTQEIGVAVASVAAKVSLIIPVLIAVPLYGDEMPWVKVVGITLALLSVFLTFYARDERLKSGRLWFLPVILFIGTGLLDTLLKFTQSVLLNKEQFNMFSSILFAVAGGIGLIVALIMMISTHRKFRLKNVLAGVVLGVPNYGSIYFLLQTFEHSNMESSVIFPINNMGIVALSALAAYILFSEKLSRLNWAGIGISILAIGVISFA